MLTEHTESLLKNITLYNQYKHNKDHVELLILSCNKLHENKPAEFKELFNHEAMTFAFMWEYIQSADNADRLFAGNNADMLKLFVAKMCKEIYAEMRIKHYYNSTAKDALEYSGVKAILEKIILLIKHINPSQQDRAIISDDCVETITLFPKRHPSEATTFLQSITEFCSKIDLVDKDRISSYCIKFLLWHLSNDNHMCRASEYDEDAKNKKSATDKTSINMCIEQIISMADINRQDIHGQTIAHLVFYFRHKEMSTNHSYDPIIRTLIAKKADLTIKNNDGIMPLTLILKHGYSFHSQDLQNILLHCDLTEQELEQTLSDFIQKSEMLARSSNYSFIISNLLNRIKLKNPSWDNWLLANTTNTNIVDCTSPAGEVFSYLILLKIPFSTIFKLLEAIKNVNLENFILHAIYNKEAYAPEIIEFNDVWAYLASSSACVDLIKPIKFEAPLKSGFYRSEIEQTLIGNTKISPLNKASINHNVQFFLLIIKFMSPYFSDTTKQKIEDSLMSMDVNSNKMKPLMDYLEQYSNEHWAIFNKSWRRELYKKLINKYVKEKATLRLN